MSEIEVFHDESLTDSSDPPAAVQSTSAPQDNSTEPAAAIRGRRPSRTTAANASKRRSPPSPSPPRQQPPSPASSYTSVFSHAPSAENWTVAGLRQVITSAGVIIPRRSSKADLLALYNSLQSGELQKSSTPLKSAATASKSRKSPYSRPGPTFTPSRTGLRPPNRSGRPSASLGRAPDVAALSPHLPRASTEHQLAIQPSEEPAFASTSRLTRTSTLDDFLIISPPDSIPAAHLLTTQKVFSELGIPLASDKTAGPSTSIEFLGINLDSQKFQASLPKEKIDRMILVASTLAANPICSKRELLSVLGHLNFAMRIIPQGRPFISHLLTLASSTHALEDQIALTDSCCNELSLWISFFKRWNGLSFFYKNLISSPVDIQLFTDAAPSIGYGGFYQGRWFASTWPCQLSNLPQSAASSALFELYPIVIAAFLWGKEWSATSILIHCDNEATVHCVNKSRSHSPMLNPLLRRLTWISACDQFIITARHIPGSKNQIADSLSRFSFQKFRTLAPEADPLPTPVPPFSELIFP